MRVRTTLKHISVGCIIWMLGVGLFHTTKPLPSNLSYESEWKSVEDLSFYQDISYQESGVRVQEPTIFPAIHHIIEKADRFILLDMFLFNQEQAGTSHPTLSQDIVDALIEKRKQNPNLPIVVITDPINTFYGSYPAMPISQLTAHNIPVVYTDLTKLRDSNPIYSSIWRTWIQWFGTSQKGWIQNPLSDTAPDVTLRSYLSLFNFKANHRKVILTDKTALVSSANPHDASGYHSNVAVSVTGPILYDIFQSEMALLHMSNPSLHQTWTKLTPSSEEQPFPSDSVRVKVVTEGRIKASLLSTIQRTKKGDHIDIGMFYLSDRDVIKALKQASNRDVIIRLILDPNKDAFGRGKNGVPNRSVAHELHQETSIDIRWYQTHGEQFHSKFAFVKTKNNTYLLLGSSNFTTRNLDNLNAESNLFIRWDTSQNPPSSITHWNTWEQYFDRLWSNKNGSFTTSYSTYEDTSTWHTFLYRISNLTGISTY